MNEEQEYLNLIFMDITNPVPLSITDYERLEELKRNRPIQTNI